MQPGEAPRARMGVVVRGGLYLLAAGVVVVYLLLGQALSKRAYQTSISQQLSAQQTLACMVAGRLDDEQRHGQDAVAAFNELAELTTLQFGPGFGGFTLMDPSGEIITQLGASEYQPPASLEGLMVRDPHSPASLTLSNYARLKQPAAGLLYTAAGAFQHQSVAVSRIAANDWSLLVHRDTLESEELAAVLRIYVLVAFLVLAVLLLLFILGWYYALAGVFNRAVQSAEAINTASRAFQESLGVMRGPLHNIQGLTDMLCMAPDADERQLYADEIKAEVGKLIALFKKSEF